MRYWLWSGIGLIVVTAGLIVIPNVVPPRTISSPNACVANLKYIQRLKGEWVDRNHVPSNSIPSIADLFPQREADMPACPTGGQYRIGAVNEKPTCSIGPPVHTL
jgi:hypothetical protein